MNTQSVLREQDYQRLTEAVSRLHRETSAKVVFLFDRNGQQITMQGATLGIDVTSFASLTAGNVAATEGLAKLVGENAFPAQYHEGVQNSIYIATLEKKAILVVVFNEYSSVGLVRLRVKRAILELNKVYEDIAQKELLSSSQDENVEGFPSFGDISEEDIENFFTS